MARQAGAARREPRASTAWPSTTRAISASARSPRASFRTAWNISGSRRSILTTRRARARSLAEAGYPNGFDAGDLSGETFSGSGIGEPVVNDLNAVGIRVRLRLLERATYLKQWGDKTLKNIILAGSGAPGNAATRLEQYAVTGGLYAYGSYPEVDGLYNAQANESNPRARRQILVKMQQIIHERVMFGPVLEYAYLVAVGPRVAVDSVNALPDDPYTAPYEDLRLKPDDDEARAGDGGAPRRARRPRSRLLLAAQFRRGEFGRGAGGRDAAPRQDLRLGLPQAAVAGAVLRRGVGARVHGLARSRGALHGDPRARRRRGRSGHARARRSARGRSRRAAGRPCG